MEAITQTPAGWYPDPEARGTQRYWDGNEWTDHRAPAAASTTRRDTDMDAIIWALVAIVFILGMVFVVLPLAL